VIVEGAVVSRGPVPMRPRCIRSFRGKSGGGKGEVDNNRHSALRVWHLAMVPRVGECTCGPGGYERVEMRRGEVRKQTDVPLQVQLIVRRDT
jgi:hypothetical protein